MDTACSICRIPYNIRHQPMISCPRHHTACEDCLRSFFRQMSCPQCDSKGLTLKGDPELARIYQITCEKLEGYKRQNAELRDEIRGLNHSIAHLEEERECAEKVIHTLKDRTQRTTQASFSIDNKQEEEYKLDFKECRTKIDYIALVVHNPYIKKKPSLIKDLL